MKLFSVSEERGGDYININECLTKAGFAEYCAEGHVSQENHRKRLESAAQLFNGITYTKTSLPPKDWAPGPNIPPSVVPVGARKSGRKVGIFEPNSIVSTSC